MLFAAIAVKLSSSGPVLFKQKRMGTRGREFVIYKFRTMRAGAGPGVTRKGDSRLTPIGGILRRLKIDEVPQLLNVLKGDMSLVGARPKLPHHQTYPLQYRPGITGAASLAFRSEEELLHHVTDCDLDEFQVEVMMPLKKYIDQTYMTHATFASDLRVLWATVSGQGERLDYEQLRSFQQSLLSLDAAVRTNFQYVDPREAETATLAADAAG
jgi:lipopolysaccharide/colanic/teichoic acid biosynthesis glycosyltransferase